MTISLILREGDGAGTFHLRCSNLVHSDKPIRTRRGNDIPPPPTAPPPRHVPHQPPMPHQIRRDIELLGRPRAQRNLMPDLLGPPHRNSSHPRHDQAQTIARHASALRGPAGLEVGIEAHFEGDLGAAAGGPVAGLELVKEGPGRGRFGRVVLVDAQGAAAV
jgi:hypothetical protein